jgi:hypothetical protein
MYHVKFLIFTQTSVNWLIICNIMQTDVPVSRLYGLCLESWHVCSDFFHSQIYFATEEEV